MTLSVRSAVSAAGLALVLGGFHAHPARAQVEPVRGPALNVFLDCHPSACDFDHFRREIRFVNWMRDAQDAALHVLVTGRATAAGGEEITVDVLGRGAFAGVEDRLRYHVDASATASEAREALTQALRLGLARYLVGTEQASWLRLFYQPPVRGAGAADRGGDPWNYWVFRISLSGAYSGEESTSSTSFSGDLSIDRTTENWKFNLVVDGRYQEGRFELSEGTRLVSISRSYAGETLLVGSLGSHFSAGARGRVASSTFSNYDLFVRFGPALEYSVLPYAESTRRQIRFLYSIGAAYSDYTEETIFDRTEETQYEQSLAFSMAFTQPWGNLLVSVVGAHFLEGFDQNRLTVLGIGEVRLVRGLSLSLFGSVSHVANQRNLPRGTATDDEILLRRKELATSFLYSASVGFSYTFGSRFANIVNPRFGG